MLLLSSSMTSGQKSKFPPSAFLRASQLKTQNPVHMEIPVREREDLRTNRNHVRQGTPAPNGRKPGFEEMGCKLIAGVRPDCILELPGMLLNLLRTSPQEQPLSKNTTTAVDPGISSFSNSPNDSNSGSLGPSGMRQSHK